jgi:hypothetical protein
MALLMAGPVPAVVPGRKVARLPAGTDLLPGTRPVALATMTTALLHPAGPVPPATI